MSGIWPDDIQCVALITFDVDGVSSWLRRNADFANYPSLPSMAEYGPSVAELEAERALVEGNRALVERMDGMIQAAIGWVWGGAVES